MDPSRKRAIRLTVALAAAVLLASALVYVSFTAGNKEFTASQLLAQGKPGQTYELAGTVLTGSVQHEGPRCCSGSAIPSCRCRCRSGTAESSPTRSRPAGR